MPLDSWKRVFECKDCKTSLKLEARASVNKWKKGCQNTAQIHEKYTLELKTKTLPKSITPKNRKAFRKWIPDRSQKVTSFPGVRLLDGFWAPLVLKAQGTPKVSLGTEHGVKNDFRRLTNILKVFLKTKLLETSRTNCRCGHLVRRALRAIQKLRGVPLCNIQECLKAFLARCTARSASNIYIYIYIHI